MVMIGWLDDLFVAFVDVFRLRLLPPLDPPTLSSSSLDGSLSGSGGPPFGPESCL